MKSAHDVLTEALALIGDPARWTQNCFARRADNRGTDPMDPKAVCWCAMGAIQRVVSLTGKAEAIRYLAEEARYEGIFEFDDSHTHGEVVALFKRAIERAKQ